MCVNVAHLQMELMSCGLSALELTLSPRVTRHSAKPLYTELHGGVTAALSTEEQRPERKKIKAERPLLPDMFTHRKLPW